MRAPPEKRCGTCKSCCNDLKIDTPEFHKEAAILCQHYTGTGCGIYTKRYQICREFLCGWRLFPELDDAWRPDRSGVLILQVAQQTLPQKYQPAGHGVKLVILGGEAAIDRPGFAQDVIAMVARGAAVYLTTVSPQALINTYLEPLAAAKDIEGARRVLLQVYRLARAGRDRKGLLGMLPYLYGLQVELWRSRLGKKSKNTK